MIDRKVEWVKPTRCVALRQRKGHVSSRRNGVGFTPRTVADTVSLTLILLSNMRLQEGLSDEGCSNFLFYCDGVFTWGLR
jgi:hypothetical protein